MACVVGTANSLSSGSVTGAGWLPCNGAIYNKTQAPDLYAVIGNLYGTAPNSFAVPNLQGMFVIGVGTMALGAALRKVGMPVRPVLKGR